MRIVLRAMFVGAAALVATTVFRGRNCRAASRAGVLKVNLQRPDRGGPQLGTDSDGHRTAGLEGCGNGHHHL